MRLISAVSGVQVPAPPPFPPQPCSSPIASSRPFGSTACCRRQAVVCSSRSRAARTRSGFCTCSASSAARGELTVAGAAHLNHGLREAADEDERFCRELAADLGIPVCVERADVRALARGLAHLTRRRRTSCALRVPRARCRRAERQRGCDRSHPRRPGGDLPPAVDPRRRSARAVRDRPEASVSSAGLSSTSVGTRSASGSPPRGLPFREDESNRDLAFTRNRVRHRAAAAARAGLLARDRRGARPRVGNRPRRRGLSAISSNRIGAFRRLSK